MSPSPPPLPAQADTSPPTSKEAFDSHVQYIVTVTAALVGAAWGTVYQLQDNVQRIILFSLFLCVLVIVLSLALKYRLWTRSAFCLACIVAHVLLFSYVTRLPNLKVVEYIAPSGVAQGGEPGCLTGGRQEAKWVIKNEGQAKSEPFEVAISDEEGVLDRLHVAGLGPHQTTTVALDLTTSQQRGQTRLVAVVDAGKAVPEWDENDPAKQHSVPVTIWPYCAEAFTAHVKTLSKTGLKEIHPAAGGYPVVRGNEYYIEVEPNAGATVCRTCYVELTFASQRARLQDVGRFYEPWRAAVISYEVPEETTWAGDTVMFDLVQGEATRTPFQVMLVPAD